MPVTRTDELRHRLLGFRPTDALWGWLGPGLIALVGGVLRFWNLDRPHALVFDIGGEYGLFKMPYSPMSPVSYPLPPPPASARTLPQSITAASGCR